MNFTHSMLRSWKQKHRKSCFSKYNWRYNISRVGIVRYTCLKHGLSNEYFPSYPKRVRTLKKDARVSRWFGHSSLTCIWIYAGFFGQHACNIQGKIDDYDDDDDDYYDEDIRYDGKNKLDEKRVITLWCLYRVLDTCIVPYVCNVVLDLVYLKRVMYVEVNRGTILAYHRAQGSECKFWESNSRVGGNGKHIIIGSKM